MMTCHAKECPVLPVSILLHSTDDEGVPQGVELVATVVHHPKWFVVESARHYYDVSWWSQQGVGMMYKRSGQSGTRSNTRLHR